MQPSQRADGSRHGSRRAADGPDGPDGVAGRRRGPAGSAATGCGAGPERRGERQSAAEPCAHRTVELWCRSRRGDACQVFGGDRVQDRRRCFPTHAYVEAARRLLSKYGHKTIRVASDSPAAISEFAAMRGDDVAVEVEAQQQVLHAMLWWQPFVVGDASQ